MSSVQERLQLKRVPLDKWSVQEQLCLASAVACSGDQNWMSVSRSLKMLCSSSRPSDWFSQKSCAAQYGKLLENVETPKRKKRTISERDNSAVETPSELIVRKLTQERIIELKKLILDEQQQYLKFKEDVMAVQMADTSKLRDMWNQIETETKQKEKERFQHSQWLKEREERKLEMERAWRPGGINVTLSGAPLSAIPTINPLSSNLPTTDAQILPQSSKTPLTLKIKTEDPIDVDELSSQTSITSTKPGTSPLLTSLLKSPSQTPISTSTTTPINVVLTTITSQQFPSTAVRNSSPTITNLLTSNIMTTTPSTDIKASLPTQSCSSTLSKLLEPTETDSTDQMDSTILIKQEIKKEDGLLPFTDLTIESPSSNENDSNKDEDQQLMEVFNGLIPDNIDELADILTQTNAIISLSPELLEEGSILGNVDTLIDSHEEIDQASNIKETVVTENKNDNIMNSKTQMENIKIEDEIKSEWNEEEKPVIYKEEADKLNVEKIDDVMNTNNLHHETTSSSNSNITIPEETTSDLSKKGKANVQRSISDDETQITKSETHQRRDISQQPSPQSSENDIMIIEDNTPPASEHDTTVESKSHPATDPKNDESMLETIAKDENKDSSIDDSKMVIEVIDENEQKENKDTDSEINSKIDQCDTKGEKSEQGPIEIVVKSNQSSIDKSDDDNFDNIKEDLQLIEDSKDIQDIITQSISLIDTDDDSPIEVIKEDKIGKLKRDYSRKKLDNQKIEDNTIDELNKPGLSLRLKLKERERSESPFVLDDDNDDIPKIRRRYSSTPNIDSIPNSPASSTATNDDRDYKLWKKSILIAFNRIQMHKHSSIFQKLDDQNTNYKKIIFRPIDLISIKKNVETEIIRSTVEFQRDIMLMCNNLLFLNEKMHLTVKEFLQDALNTIDSTCDCTRKDEKIGLSGGSTGGSSTSSTLNQSQSSSSSFSTSGKGRGGRKSSRMSNV